jgi:acyl-CoA synthetase (AMP-forming)/AMP-acid ligase II
MRESFLLPDLVTIAAERSPGAQALSYGNCTLDYAELAEAIQRFAGALAGLELERAGRVAIWLEKRFETVVASLGAPAAGGVFVPVNPLLKPEQVAYIARDCDVRVLVTSPERLSLLAPRIAECPALQHIVLTEAAA